MSTFKATFLTPAELFEEGEYYSGKTHFSFGVNLTQTTSGFEWELDVPNQSFQVYGEKYNKETGEDDEFVKEVPLADLTEYKIKLTNKEAIQTGNFVINRIYIDPKAKKLEIEFI